MSADALITWLNQHKYTASDLFHWTTSGKDVPDDIGDNRLSRVLMRIRQEMRISTEPEFFAERTVCNTSSAKEAIDEPKGIKGA